jgi:MoaA/NifB/PqqE/SkfB family radical SAM enzyme/NADP-dependent 3-hydroxy acid dehydrogenase YdfG
MAKRDSTALTMFNFNVIDEYQLEITTYCNAACPQCPRNNNGSGVNPYLKLEHLSRKVIDSAFTADLCHRLRQIFFCGSYGDPIMHPEFLDILRDFRRKSPTLWLYIHTNGGAHSPEYWKDLAEIIGNHGQVDFNIDGLADTNWLYRRNTDFDKIISNAQAYINAGGRAVWNFIVFEHNQHQVESAQKLSKELGFYDFKYRATGRFLNHRTMETFDTWPTQNREGLVEYVIQPTTLKKYKNKSIEILPDLKQQHNDMKSYFATTEICCDSLTGNKVAINASGLVLPCNMLNHNLSDARFRDPEVLPCSNELSTVNGQNQVQAFIDQHGADNLNIHHRSLEQVFANSFWSALVASWEHNTFPERLFECAMTCGKQFTKVWDQTKMTKTYLITGGNRGLGKHLLETFAGDSRHRGIGYDITNPADVKRIAEESLKYDVFVNNAFDGPPQESWANFAQSQVYFAVYDAWKAAGKSGHIFNIGSSGSKTVIAPEPRFETYRVSKAALEHASKQGTQAFKQNGVLFKTTLITLDRLDTELSRGRPTWTGNGINLTDISNFIQYATTVHANTVIEEATFYVNFDHKA